MNYIQVPYMNQIIIKHSKFIAELFPVVTQVEARNKIKELKEYYFDSTHVVHAFILGNNAQIMGMSDDGEPSGTAGRPVLDVLKGSGCTNVLLTVTRYFGGTLLGTGGLVKAYSDSAKAVLQIAQMYPLIEQKNFSLTCNYQNYEQVKRLLQTNQASNIKENFETEIKISGSISVEFFSELKNKLSDISNGSIIL